VWQQRRQKSKTLIYCYNKAEYNKNVVSVGSRYSP